MKLYNTLTKKVDEFVPNNKDEVKMYTCGPTVYHYAHIGNLRTYICEDVLEKALNYIGYKVTRCMNITDVGHLVSDADSGEDKMLKGAKRENKTVMEIAKMYTDAFKNDCDLLNIKWPEIVVPATSQIDEYIKMITKLLDTGYAYKSGENIYFDTSKLDNYYVLTNNSEDDILEAVRSDVEVDSNKKNKNDFVLWFTKSKFENQALKWDSPWGVGYPGWHIECSAISLKYLGEYLDIHCGGVDNIFPHHTNEIAQTESYIGHKWCNYWFHPQHLNDKSGKMSKSKGEFLTVSLLRDKGYDPLAYRMLVLQSHYRKQVVFSYDALDQVETALKKLRNKISNITEDGIVDNDKFNEFNTLFKKELENDLNTANAITILYDVVKSELNGATKLALIKEFDKVLSLNLIEEKTNSVSSELEMYINEMISKRAEAKKNKDFILADSIRNDLLEKNIEIKDTREGTTWSLIEK